jgi:hypothetical protein
VSDDQEYTQVPARTEPRKGVQCGLCHQKFKASVAYAWTCKDALCPFDYGPFFVGTVEAPRSAP